MLMRTRKKKLLIPEENYKSDFAPLSGFYNYHVKGKDISVSLDEIQGFGVTLEPKKRQEIANVNVNSLMTNTIIFSSSKKKYNVKNLIWTIRCLVAHPENIEEKSINGVKYYNICCSTKDKITGKVIPTMKGLVARDLWPKFTEQLINKIKEEKI